MSISCDCSMDIGDTAEFSCDSFPIAKKEHKCCECRESINPGQKYHKCVGKWYGKFETIKTCMACYLIREHYCPHGYVFGELREAISDCLGFDYTDADTEDDEE